MSSPASTATEIATSPGPRSATPRARGYAVREVFRTLQGEGALCGTPMVFVRFAGCNLWSGHDVDRERDALAHGAGCPRFCDTDFVGGARLSVDGVVAAVQALAGPRWICFTGGEPALQLDRPLLEATRAVGYRAAIETNGTLPLDDLAPLIDWLCVSPKTPALRVTAGDELKLVYAGQPREALLPYEELAFAHLSLQPEWGPHYQRHLAGALELLQGQSRWRLSLQTHKILGLP